MNREYDVEWHFENGELTLEAVEMVTIHSDDVVVDFSDGGTFVAQKSSSAYEYFSAGPEVKVIYKDD